jgi:hypothetical protein
VLDVVVPVFTEQADLEGRCAGCTPTSRAVPALLPLVAWLISGHSDLAR